MEKLNVIRVSMQMGDHAYVKYKVIITDDIQTFIQNMYQHATELIEHSSIMKLLDAMNEIKGVIEAAGGEIIHNIPSRPVTEVKIIGGIDGVRLGNHHSVEQWLHNEGSIGLSALRSMDYIQLMRAFDKKVDELVSLSSDNDRFAEIMKKATSHLEP